MTNAPTVSLSAAISILRRAGPAALSIAAALVLAAPATAQEGPIPPRDLGAIDQQLHTILQVAPPGAPRGFRAPSGASVDVRSFSPVTRRSGRPCVNCANPCRGYQVDYVTADRSERVVLEGFRCRRPDGIWVMVQPETIVARESANPTIVTPVDDTVPEMSEEELRRRGILPPEETAAGDGQPVPLSPDAATADAQPLPGASDDVDSAPLPDVATETTQPASEPATDTATATTQPTAPEPTQTPETRGPARTAEARPITAADTVSRVIYPGGSNDAVPTPTASAQTQAEDSDMETAFSDPAVVDRLKELHYLSAGTNPADRETIRQAVGEFAVDEQFALPLDASALTARLNAAAERNRTIATCSQQGSIVTVCEEN